RFLWRGSDRSRPPDEFVMTSMIFGAKSSPCSAQYVRDENAWDSLGKYPDAVQAILKRHFMDNYLDSFESSVEARTQIQDIFNIHADGGFQMCSWLTNDPGLMNWIPATLRTDSDKSLDFELGLPQERILGLKWDPNSDSLTFNLKFHRVDAEVMNMDRSPTKREFLRILMSIFDPLGMDYPTNYYLGGETFGEFWKKSGRSVFPGVTVIGPVPLKGQTCIFSVMLANGGMLPWHILDLSLRMD
ncbi:unnamed protein product, partial [Allacma fusca]